MTEKGPALVALAATLLHRGRMRSPTQRVPTSYAGVPEVSLWT
jgi:hypothetical protein